MFLVQRADNLASICYIIIRYHIIFKFKIEESGRYATAVTKITQNAEIILIKLYSIPEIQRTPKVWQIKEQHAYSHCVDFRSGFHFSVIMVRTITRWTEEETALLLKLVDQYRNNFKLVASIFPSRSYNQVKGHYFNALRKIKTLEEIIQVQQRVDSEVTAEKSKDNQNTQFNAFQE
ncbi:SANT/Myb_domain [Hexamita inflata]|uniref:SANT/Myb domain n=2 Tax=Hexamita inflata TaxID=28002 RepID=A0AA86VJ31_9EUKA|nr:SANT/Myb domain [Hexamita inflata]